MPTSSKRIKNNDTVDTAWNRLKKHAEVTGLVVVILSVGYGVGTFKETLDWKVEKLQIDQNCNDRVKEAENSLKNCELSQYQKEVNDLKNVVDELKRKK